MFLCKVAAGRALRAPADWMDEAEVRAQLERGGYHSLLGEPPGGPAHEAAAAAAAAAGSGGLSSRGGRRAAAAAAAAAAAGLRR